MMKLPNVATTAFLAICFSHPAAAQGLWIVGTGPQGSLSFSTGTAVAQLMNSKTELKFRSRAMGGSSSVLPQVDANKVHFSLNNALETRHIYLGEGTFKGKPLKNTRILCGIYPLRTLYAVANNSGIKALAELKGKRIPSEFTSQTIFVELSRAVLASAGINPTDVQGVPTSNYIKGGDLLASGRVDGALVAPGSGGSRKQHAQMSNVGGLRFIPIGSDVKAMKAVFPEAYPQKVPKNPKIPGLINDVVAMDYPFYITTNKFLPDDVAYAVTKAIFENKAELLKAVPAFGRFDAKRDMGQKHSTTPFHPGAAKFLQEAGIWQGGKIIK